MKLSELARRLKPYLDQGESSGGGGSGTLLIDSSQIDHNATYNLMIGDVHPQYLTTARGDARYILQSSGALLHARLHTITDPLDHQLPAGATALQMLGAEDDGLGGVTLAMLTPQSDVRTVNQNSILRDAAGVLGVGELKTPLITETGDLTIAPTGNLIVDAIQKSSAYTIYTTGASINWTAGTVNVRDTWTDSLKTNTAEILDIYQRGGSNPISIHLSPTAHLLMDDDDSESAIQKWVDYTGEGLGGIYLDWASGYGDFGDIHASSLTVDMLYFDAAQVKAGRLVVGQSGSELTRPFTLPLVGNSGTLYIKNIPGAGDMPISRDGNDWAMFYYDAGDGSISKAPSVYRTASGIAYATTGTGGTIDSEDWQSYSNGDLPNSTWKMTDKNNSTSTANTWKVLSIGGTLALASDPATDGDVNFHIHYNGSGAANLDEMEITGKFYSASNSPGRGVTLMSKYVDASPSDTYVRVRRYSSNNYHVATHGYANPDGGTTDSGYIDTASEWTLFRVRIEDDGTTTTLYAKFWNENDSEPASWQINCYWTGSSRPQTGTFGFWSMKSLTNRIYIDDVVATDLGTSAQGPSLTLELDSTDYALAIVQHEGSDSVTPPPSWYLDSSHTISGQSDTQRLYFRSDPQSHGVYHWSMPSTTDWMAVTMVSLDEVQDTPVLISKKDYDADINGWSSYSGQMVAGERHLLVDILAFNAPPLGTVITPDETTTAAYYQDGTNYGAGVYSRVVEDTFPQANYQFTYDQIGTLWTVDFTGNAPVNTGVVMGMAYGTVVQDLVASHEDDEQVWTWTTTRGPSRTVQIGVGAGVHDLGVEGDAYWEANVIDGLSGGPYSQIVERGANPWDKTSKLRLGYLGGTQASGGLGLYFEQDNHVAELSEYAQRLRNININLEDGSGNVVLELDANFGINVVAGSFSIPQGYYSGYTFRDAAVDPTIQDSVFGGLYADVTSQSSVYTLALNVKDTQYRDSRVEVQAGNGTHGNDATALIGAGLYSPSLAPFAGFNAEAIHAGKSLISVEGKSRNGYEAEAKLSAIQGVSSPPTAAITAKVTAAGVTSITLDAGTITTGAGYAPSADQDVARKVDVDARLEYSPNQISYKSTRFTSSGSSASQWVKLMTIAFNTATYKRVSIHGQVMTNQSGYGFDQFDVFVGVAGTGAYSPKVMGGGLGNSAIFSEFWIGETAGSGTNLTFELWGKYRGGWADGEIEYRIFSASSVITVTVPASISSADMTSTAPTSQGIGSSSTRYFIYHKSSPSFASGWTNYNDSSGLYANAKYSKHGRRVTLEGLVKRTSGSSSIIFTLSGSLFAPDRRHIFAVYTASGVGRVDVDTSGNVILKNGSASWVSLDGIEWFTYQ